MFLKKIFGLFGKKIVKKEYFLKTEPGDFSKLPKGLREENAFLFRENKELKNDRQKFLKIIESLKGDVDRKKQEHLEDQQRRYDQEEKEGRIDFMFSGSKPILLRSFIGKRPFKFTDGRYFSYLRGMSFEDTDSGPFVSFLLSLSPHDKKFGRLRLGSLENFPQVFRNPVTLVQDLKAGDLVINISPEGNFIFPLMQVSR